MKGRGREMGLEADSIISLWEPESTCRGTGHGVEETDVEGILERVADLPTGSLGKEREKPNGPEGFRVWVTSRFSDSPDQNDGGRRGKRF